MTPLKKWPTAILAALMLMCLSVGVFFWPPTFSSLREDSAFVQHLDINTSLAIKAVLRTQAGYSVTFACSTKIAGCAKEKFQELKSSGAVVKVWHDGLKVFQLTTSSGVLVSYASLTEDSMIWVLCGIFAFALVIRLAMHAGLVNVFKPKQFNL